MENTTVMIPMEMEAKIDAALQNDEFMSKVSVCGSVDEVKANFLVVDIELDDEGAKAFLNARDTVKNMEELPEELLECVNGGGPLVATILGGVAFLGTMVAGALLVTSFAGIAITCGVAVGAAVAFGAAGARVRI